MGKLPCQHNPTLLGFLYLFGSLYLIKHHLLLLHLPPLTKQIPHISPILLFLLVQDETILSIDPINYTLESFPQYHLREQAGIGVDEVLDLFDLRPVFTSCELFEISLTTDLVILQFQLHAVIAKDAARITISLLDLEVLCLHQERGTSAALADLNSCRVFEILSENRWQLL